jgi:ssDNA-binding Zn-finger/Zn-ribbon topoisomerase 1
MKETLCPECGGPMVSRANKSTGQRFWGCADYPKCTGTRDTDGESAAERRGELPPSERLRENDRQRWRS